MAKITAGFLWRQSEGAVEPPGPVFMLDFILADSQPVVYLEVGEDEALIWRTIGAEPTPRPAILPNGYIRVATEPEYYLSAGITQTDDRAIITYGSGAAMPPIDLPDELVLASDTQYLTMGSGRALVWSS